MIKYELLCDQDHTFDSWFRDSAAYDRMAEQGVLSCPVCGSAKVSKALMAPRLARRKGHDDREETRRRAAAATAAAIVGAGLSGSGLSGGGMATGTPSDETSSGGDRSAVPGGSRGDAGTEAVVPAPVDPAEVRQALKVVRSFVEQNFDYVGPGFAEEARKIHYGESDARAIYGEATPEEQADLRDEGVEVYALPDVRDDA